MSKVNFIHWGIIGCGDVCEVKSGPAFNKVGNSKLVAVMRRDLAKAEDYAKRHGVPRFYADADALINDPEVNAIYIATPPSSHELYLEKALAAGKSVYVEKPVAVDSRSCKRMIQVMQRHKGKVVVAHYRRGLSAFRTVKALLAEQRIGNVRTILLRTLQPPPAKVNRDTQDNWRLLPDISGGGIFHDLSPHQLDILYWIFGKPVSLHGMSANQSKLYSAPDLTLLHGVFEPNIMFSGTWAFNIAPSAADERCEIIGDKGRITFSFFKLGDVQVTTEDGTETLPMEYPENIQYHMIDAVTRFFLDEGPNPCSLEEAYDVMEMMEAAKEM